MNDSIVNQLAVDPGVAAKHARKQYLHLLRNEQMNNEENRASLSVAAHVLGKTAEQVGADALVIRRVKQLEELTRSQTSIEFTAKQAATTLERFDTETAELQAGRAQRRSQLASDMAAANGRAAEAKNAQLEIQQLRNTNPDLLV